MYQNEAFDPFVKEKRFSRSSDFKLRDIWGLCGQNQKLFKARQFIYKNYALAHVIWKKR